MILHFNLCLSWSLVAAVDEDLEVDEVATFADDVGKVNLDLDALDNWAYNIQVCRRPTDILCRGLYNLLGTTAWVFRVVIAMGNLFMPLTRNLEVCETNGILNILPDDNKDDILIPDRAMVWNTIY